MANATAKAVMKQAILQNGYTEHPAGSNKTKFGKLFGTNGVAWCFIYEWWCGETASGGNPFPHNSNAAYGQDEIVSKKGGKWVMKKTASNSKKKKGLAEAQFGDCVDFDFGRNNKYRQHTALMIGRDGNHYICIEGNTSATSKGSQSNGGCVAIRYRHYSEVCAIARPKYSASAKHTISTPYTGKVPTLPKRGFFRKGDKGTQVKYLQNALKWATGEKLEIDGEFGNATLFAVIWLQHTQGIAPDGEFGAKSLAKLNAIIKAHKTPKAKTKADKIVDMAKDCSYAYGTPKAEYSYPKGKPKAAYKKALDKAYPDRSKWSEQTRAGASCDVFVGTVIRASGVDAKFPRGLDEIPKYIKNHKDKWINTGITERAKMKAGDVIYEDYGGKGTGAHVSIYLGGDRIAQAQHTGKTYPHITKYTSQIHNPKKCDLFAVYRIKE